MKDTIATIKELIEPLLEGTDMFIVRLIVKPTNNVKVFLDADSGLSIEKSATLNRRLYPLIEASGLFPEGDFSLEVSSPGVDEPLTSLRQYKKNIGRTLSVFLEGTDKEETGILKEVEEDHIVLEKKVKGRKETREETLPFSLIKKSIVQVVF